MPADCLATLTGIIFNNKNKQIYMDLPLLKSIGDALTSQFGVAGIIILGLGVLIYRLVNKIIADKDEQIKRLSDENEKYKAKFMTLLDKIHNFVPENETKK
jgi:hypothetical protein